MVTHYIQCHTSPFICILYKAHKCVPYQPHFLKNHNPHIFFANDRRRTSEGRPKVIADVALVLNFTAMQIWSEW